ncbi:MAG: sensor histidine kinase [Jatrophihabitans sp.]|nr:MAG: sensor histidine kinase [Jatrophihabitans sp.]
MRAFRSRTGSWGGGWRRWVFPGIWLIYLVQTAADVDRYSSGAAAVAGYGIIVAFCACYLGAISSGWELRIGRFWLLFCVAAALTGVETIFARDGAFVFFVYLAVLAVAGLRERAWPLVAGMGLVTLFGPALFGGWRAGQDWSGALAVVLVGLAMYGFFSVIQSNIELAEARAEVARLAAENERTRIARDLHDLLGHSLTTITVKAGLARRLAQRGDHSRAAAEIGEVEALSRSTLADVRAAVAGHRDVTLAGELATAREVLRASGVEAELPASVAEVAPQLSELFGWVVRESVTNVVRHAHAQHCTVAVGGRWIEVRDDGRGGLPGAGTGLIGLRERVDAAGGTVRAGGVGVGGVGAGWRVRVDVPADRPVRVAAP